MSIIAQIGGITRAELFAIENEAITIMKYELFVNQAILASYKEAVLIYSDMMKMKVAPHQQLKNPLQEVK